MKQPRHHLTVPARSAPQNLLFRLPAELIPADDRDTDRTSMKVQEDQGSTEESGLQ